MKTLVAALALAAGVALAADSATIAPFSAVAAGDLPNPWRVLALARIKAPQFALVSDEGLTVLRVRAEQAAGSASHGLDADPGAAPILSWRWKVDRVLEGADMTRKAGDDFAARVYVFFDLPMEALSFTDRMRIRVARSIYGREVPTAAICYVWDNRHPAGTSLPSAYTDRVRLIVLESGAAQVAKWTEERRDLEKDFRDAFGTAMPVPRISGLAAGADTDQTGERVTAWFGDFRLGRR